MCSNLIYIDIYIECMMWKLIVTEKKNLDKVNDVGRIRQLTVVFFSGDLPELHFVNGHFRWIKRYWRWRIKEYRRYLAFFFSINDQNV